MSKVSITRSKLDDLATTISAKSGATLPLTLAQMQTAVSNIPSGSVTVEALSVDTNGTYTAPSGTAYSPVTVNVSDGSPTLQTKTKSYTPTTSQQTETVTADGGYDGLDTVNITVAAMPTATVTSSVTPDSLSAEALFNSETGAFTAMAYIDDSIHPISSAGYASTSTQIDIVGEASDSYQLPTQSATTITPTESSQTAVVAGKYTTGAVTVGAISSTYVGSGITQRSSSDLTASGATVTVPAGYYSAQATKSVASGTAGTPTATKGTVSNHSVSVTPSVTNTSGYITGGTKSGTAVTVSASELVSGTYTVDSSGTKDVTNYASATIPEVSYSLPTYQVNPTISVDSDGLIFAGYESYMESTAIYQSGWASAGDQITAYTFGSATEQLPIQTLPNGTSSSSVGTLKASILPSTSQRYINIPAGFNPTAQNYLLIRTEMMPLSVTENGTYNATDYDVYGFDSVTVNVSGGGGSSMQTDSVEGGTMSASSITFTGLKGEPLYYSVTVDNNVTTGTPAKIAAITYDGTTLHGQTITNTTNAQVSYDGSSFSHSYSNGSLTITSTGASFMTGEAYFLDYAYGGSAANVNSEDVQVGSGATSITFTGLEDEPMIWSCIFKSNFGTSSGYQRVIYTGKISNGLVIGFAMDSSAHVSNGYWTATYNNGSLTITSQGTNAGGYFHQPGYYQLTYVLGEASPYQAKTVTPTTSQQIVEPDTGYDALSQVTVNAIPNTYVQPTSTIGATTYRASTSNQTINAGTYHSGAATIAAVSATNLSAENIKSGTTISISNGQSNIWSVTGTYTGSGGSANFGTVTMTNSSNQNTSISFTLPSGRTPKAFFCRLTSQITRNSSYRYYYVENIRWDGSTTGGIEGRCFYMYSGQLTNITSGYSKSQSDTTYTLTSTGTRSASPGSFYNGTYELVYVY